MTLLPESGALPAATIGLGSSENSSTVPTLHLIGPGQVGRRFLLRLRTLPVRLIGVSDRSGTVCDRGGLDPVAIAGHKEQGGTIAGLPGGEALPAELAIDLLGADLVVDATPSDPQRTAEDIRRGDAALGRGGHLVLASKQALCRAVDRWLATDTVERIGCNATLGGTGLRFLAEFEELRQRWTSVALVANVTSTVILDLLAAGSTFANAFAAAGERGLLEDDPERDLRGTDAAVKLAIVVGGLTGAPVDPTGVGDLDLRQVDGEQVFAARRGGRVTRLVARASRGGESSLQLEEMAAGSPLAAPADRVVYTYTLDDGTVRVHIGRGVGHGRTADALIEDVRHHTAVLGNRRS